MEPISGKIEEKSIFSAYCKNKKLYHSTWLFHLYSTGKYSLFSSFSLGGLYR